MTSHNYDSNFIRVELPLHPGGMKYLAVKDSDMGHKFSVCSRETFRHHVTEELFLCTVVPESENLHIGSLSVQAFGYVHQPVTSLCEGMCPSRFLFLKDYVCLLDGGWIQCFHATPSSSSEHYDFQLAGSMNRILFIFGNVFAFSVGSDQPVNYITDVDEKVTRKLPDVNIPTDLVSLQAEGKFFSLSTKKVVTVHSKSWFRLIKLCLHSCKLADYGLPNEVQEEVMMHVGLMDSGFVNNRRVNFTDEQFSRSPISIS